MRKIAAEALRSYLAGLTPAGDIDEMVTEMPQARSAEAFAANASGESGIMEKVARGQELTPPEQFHLEAIIIPDKRPAIDVVNDSFEAFHPNWLHLNDAAPRKVIEAAIPSIGRVEVIGAHNIPYGGTAFVVGHDLLMTNRHVAALFADGLGDRGIYFISGRDSAIDFRRERGNSSSAPFDVDEVVMIHPWWDMVLLRVPGLGARHAPLKLAATPADDLIGREIAVIGYPGYDGRNPADVQHRVFNGVYYVKRLQPGYLRARADVESYDRIQHVPTHDASTLGGNSGSCVVDTRSGHVVGLHFAGLYLEANYCVAASDLALDSRVIDAGVAFHGELAPERGSWTQAWTHADSMAVGEQGQLPADQPAATRPPTDPPSPPASQPAATVQGPLGGVTMTIPLHISVNLGTAVTGTTLPPDAGRGQDIIPAGGDARAAGAALERQRERPPRGKPFWDPDYATRRGFETNFLGISVPLPTPRNPGEILDAPGGGKYLHYHHFSLAMHKERRLAVMSAAMVDNSDKLKRPGNRPSGDYSRDGLAGRSKDAWFEDDRIAEGAQLPDRFFTNDRNAFDRGHVVRRDDVAWGSTYEEMRNANGDSFHSTNCSPQVSAYNQASRGTDNWGDLEVLVEKEAETERLAVFAGPVFKASDRSFKGIDNDGDVEVQIPESYWKLIVARKGGALQAFGFLLEQNLSDVAWEFAIPSRWTRFMVPISDIEAASGFDFHDSIRAADQFDTTEGVTFAAGSRIPPRRMAAPAAATEGPASPQPATGTLEAWRKQQRKAGAKSRDDAIFVVELDAPMTDATIDRLLTTALGLNVRVTALFDGDPNLDRYREVAVPGIGDADRADLFDIAQLMRDTLRAASVEPDIDSPYYDNDVEERPDEGTEESAGFAFWCWAPDESKPQDKDWAVKRLNLPRAWERSEREGKPSRGKDSLIFQPDTGVVRTHRELPANLADHPSAANFVEPGQSAEDPMTGGGNLGHGTATGSVVASSELDEVRGAAPEAELVPIRAIRSVVRFRQSRVAKAVDHARLKGAHVITMSLGGVPSRALRAALQRAVAENIIIMSAAGNCVGTVVWPARYPEVIAVAGSNAADVPWRGSSRGGSVDITAPAEFVLRADARDPADPNKASGGQGTSFAVALTAGVAACWLSHHGRDALISGLRPGETLQERFKGLLRQTAQQVPGLDPAKFGPGLPDADALIAADPVPAVALETLPAAPESVEDEVIDLFAELAGVGKESAAMLALGDGVSALELAAIGLDRARFSGLEALESRPPLSVSTSLRRLAGDAVARILTE